MWLPASEKQVVADRADPALVKTGLATTDVLSWEILPSGSAGMEPIVSVVIVTWRSRHLIDRCLKPFVGHPAWLEVIVHDNASPDGTPEHIASAYPWVRLTAGDDNLGFGRGNNAAFALCRGRYILMLNPDAFLDDLDPLRFMAGFLENEPTVAVAGPQLVHPDGRHQVGDAGWATSLLSVMGHALWLHRIFAAVPATYLSNPALLKSDVVDVDWICGACLMARRETVVQVGGFAEDIFMYGEDVELGERIRAAGWRIAYLPSVRVLHLQGATQKADGDVYVSTRWIDGLFAAKAMGVHNDAPRRLALRAILACGFGLRALAYVVKGVLKPDSDAKVKVRAMVLYARHTVKASV